MRKRYILWFLFLSTLILHSQDVYLKQPTRQNSLSFRDTANRVSVVGGNDLLVRQMNYLLKFFPNLRVKYIVIEFKRTPWLARVKPTFSSIFKLPLQRTYFIRISNHTGSTTDSVTYNNVSFMAQLGFLAEQLSIIEDQSTSGIFGQLSYAIRRKTAKGRRSISMDAQEDAVGFGLGYVMLEYNREFEEKTNIEKWSKVTGYDFFIRHYRDSRLDQTVIRHRMSELPFYVNHSFK